VDLVVVLEISFLINIITMEMLDESSGKDGGYGVRNPIASTFMIPIAVHTGTSSLPLALRGENIFSKKVLINYCN